MASILPISRRAINLASIASHACAKTNGAAAAAAAAARTLPSISTRQLSTTTIATTSPSALCTPRSNRLRNTRVPRCALLPKTSSGVGIRWNSEQSSTPVFRRWVFEDINALLPSTEGGSPPSSPQKSLILVDVREPAEMKGTGVIPGAVAVPISSQGDALFLTPDEFEMRFGYPKPGADEMGSGSGESNRDIVFYCKAGVRARAAAQMAVQAGYDPNRIGVYEGSWLDWERNGGRVEKWDGQGYE